MLLRIAVTQLRLGMYIHKMDGPWLSHPFWRTRFVLRRAEDLARLQASTVTTVWIDPAKAVPGAHGAPAEPPPSAPPNAPPEAAMPQAQVGATEAPLLSSPDDELQHAWRLRQQGIEVTSRVFADARLGKVIDLGPCRLLVDDVVASVSRDGGALLSLCRLKTVDEYTYLHSLSVCALMAALSLRLGLSNEESRVAALAGLLHDVGKAKVPMAVLNKPGPLAREEFRVVMDHPALGHAMLLEVGDTDERALDVCLHHHEKMNGAGYPHGLAGESISLYARMGAVCDVYDAVTSDRPYKAGWDPAQALGRMASWGEHLDPSIVDALVRTVGIYPPGSLVQLVSGQVGVVLENHPADWTRPVVRLFHSTRSGMPITVRDVDLASAGCRERIDASTPVDGTLFPQVPALWSSELRARAQGQRA